MDRVRDLEQPARQSVSPTVDPQDKGVAGPAVRGAGAIGAAIGTAAPPLVTAPKASTVLMLTPLDAHPSLNGEAKRGQNVQIDSPKPRQAPGPDAGSRVSAASAAAAPGPRSVPVAVQLRDTLALNNDLDALATSLLANESASKARPDQRALAGESAGRKSVKDLLGPMSAQLDEIRQMANEGDGANTESILEIAKRLRSQMDTVGKMSEEDQAKLQDAMNKQAQAMRLLSALMKAQHDTLKAIIQNMK